MKKKILFWINSGTMNIFGLAKYLQEKDREIEFFAVYDVTEKPKKYFEKQNLVNFQEIWFYHDFIKNKNNIPDLKYLRKFEKKYNINLLKFLYSERIFLYNEFYQFTNDEMLSILEHECKNFEEILDKINPDCVIMVTPYFHHDSIFFNLCQARNIEVLDLDQTRFPNKSVISFDKIKKDYDGYSMMDFDMTFEELQKYRYENSSFSKNVDFKNTKQNLVSAGLKFFLKENKNMNTHYTYRGRSKMKVLNSYLKDKVRVQKRKKFIDENFQINFEQDKKFILFTMQVTEENAILLDAPFYINQIEVIKNIAKSIPVDHILLVKEHPASFVRSWRSIEEYKELMSIPGVKLIHPDANTKELIKKSSLVMSICSSSSLDAQFLEKPSIVFADTNFSMIRTIRKIEKIEELPSMITKTINEKIDPKDIEKYVKFIEKKSFEYNLILHGQEMQKFLYHGGMLVDVDDLSENMDKYLENTKSRFNQLEKEYQKHIQKIFQK